MGLLHRIARARLASQIIRRLRRAGVTDARYQSAAFAVRFTRPGADEATVLPLEPLLKSLPRRGQKATTAGPAPAAAREKTRARRGGGRRKRRAEVDSYVAGCLSEPGLPRDWAEVCPMLRPLLRPAHLRAGIPASGPDAPLRRPRLPFLSEFVVVDQPDTMTYVGADQVASWGVTADEVFAAARGNLSGAVLHGVADEPVIVQFAGDGAYWTSHLLLDGWLARLSAQVGGEPVAFAPDHATLIVTADGSAHLPELFARAEVMYLASPRAITPMAYVSGPGGRTIPYQAAPGEPLHDCVRRAETIQRIQEYARQAETLPGATELTLVDGLRTRAVATPGALLPAADEVDWDGTIRPWSDARPELTPVPDLDPPRWTRPA
ncbi:hypothetical protein [Actinoplanes sp. NPDC089786]|uniref:hypothetical protein n=1 Tax=Actinoplanes sp. NPDC089786 TaxID=3155185 RepID=UPI0034211922